MATVQDILDGALGRSAASRLDMLEVDAPELLRVVQRALSRLYLFAARRRSSTFAQNVVVPYQSTAPLGWPFPADLLSLLRVEFASGGGEIAVTRLDDRAGMYPMPAVAEFGRVLVVCGNSGDPTNEDLRLYYAASAPTLAATSTPIPTAFPEMFHPLLELAVATYLARKEARADDLATFSAEESEWQAYFDAWLTDASIAPGDRFAGLRPAQVSAASDDGE